MGYYRVYFTFIFMIKVSSKEPNYETELNPRYRNSFEI